MRNETLELSRYRYLAELTNASVDEKCRER
jgi:hypothetical protein